MDDKTPQTIQPKQPANSPTAVSEVEVKVQPSTAERQPVKKPAVPEKDGTSFLTSFAHTVGKVGGTVTGTATQTGKAIAGLGEAAAQTTLNLISQATQGAGQTVTYVGNNWLVRRLTRFLNLGWLVGATDNVDLAKAEAAVRKLQQEHPNDPPARLPTGSWLIKQLVQVALA